MSVLKFEFQISTSFPVLSANHQKKAGNSPLFRRLCFHFQVTRFPAFLAFLVCRRRIRHPPTHYERVLLLSGTSNQLRLPVNKTVDSESSDCFLDRERRPFYPIARSLVLLRCFSLAHPANQSAIPRPRRRFARFACAQYNSSSTVQ